jgi:hypothetical protein
MAVVVSGRVMLLMSEVGRSKGQLIGVIIESHRAALLNGEPWGIVVWLLVMSALVS